MKKTLTTITLRALALMLCLSASASVYADGIINLASPGNSGEGWTFGNKTITITSNGRYTFFGNGGSTVQRILISPGATAEIELADVTINNAINDTHSRIRNSAIVCNNGSKVRILLSGVNTLSGSIYAAGIRTSGATVTIDSYGNGSLYVHGGTHGAGIGGSVFNYAQDAGNLTINGGTIHAYGGSHAAGIGGAHGGGDGGNITINGGHVHAYGSTMAAGIGGGRGGTLFGVKDSGNGGNITINGGFVYARSGGGSGEPAAIGGGGDEARLDGGYRGQSGTITITGGTVVAWAGNAAGAAIGSANGAPDGGSISISGGTVIATGMGIGRQKQGVNAVSVLDNAVVLTTDVYGHNSRTNAQPLILQSKEITIGNDSVLTLLANVTIPNNTVFTVPPGFTLYTNDKLTNHGTIINYGTINGKIAGNAARHDDTPNPLPTTIGMDTVSASGNGYTFNNHVVTITQSGSYTLTGKTTANRVVVLSNVVATVTLRNVSIESFTDSPFRLSEDGTTGSEVTLRLEGTNRLVTTHVFSAGLTVEGKAKLTITGNGSLMAQGAGKDAAPYGFGDENGGAGIGAGDEKVAGTIIINSGTITAQGGALAAGIGGGDSWGHYRAFNEQFTPVNSGIIIINGGHITAMGGEQGAGIGAGACASADNIIINGGTVRATTVVAACGIGAGFLGEGGNVTINGGIVVAFTPGGTYDPAAIGGSRRGAGTIRIAGGTVYASSATGPGIGGGSRTTKGSISIIGGAVVADAVGMGAYNGKTETFIWGQNTIVLSQSINTAQYNGATVLTGNHVAVNDYSCNVALKANFTNPAGSTLAVPEGTTFDIVNNVVINYGTITNYGTFNCSNGALINYGSLLKYGNGNYTCNPQDIPDRTHTANISVKEDTEVKVEGTGTLHAAPEDNGLLITGLTPGETFCVYNLQGQLCYRGEAHSGNKRIYLQQKGIYIVVAGERKVKAVY
ncbi:MAG: S-layer homology domain-containing protein [Bacteroidales bacterium]